MHIKVYLVFKILKLIVFLEGVSCIHRCKLFKGLLLYLTATNMESLLLCKYANFVSKEEKLTTQDGLSWR